ncbi:MAG: hypothetical protein JEY99_02960 [Spirochaetales bacterium]|nr:hypothetical protein [Spirochaetales bacterium]
MNPEKILLFITICSCSLFISCDPGGGKFSCGTGSVNVSVHTPAFLSSGLCTSDSDSRFISNNAGSLLIAVITPNFNGGVYDCRLGKKGRSWSGHRAWSESESSSLRGTPGGSPPVEGEWREYSEEGVSFGIAYSRVIIPYTDGGEQMVSGCIQNLPLNRELIFILAVIDASLPEIGDSFFDVMNQIDDESTGLTLGRGYVLASLDSSPAVLNVSIMPTVYTLVGNIDLSSVGRISYPGNVIEGLSSPRSAELYSCRGNPGMSYRFELSVLGGDDECLLYIYDRRGRPLGQNPQAGNRGEFTVDTGTQPDYFWNDLVDSPFYICIYGNYDDGFTGFDSYIYEL